MLLTKDFAKNISSWELDETFIKTALELAKSAKVISFDIFDTALTRAFDSPTDVFSAVESILIERYGLEAKGFARAREEAESLARKNLWEKQRAEDIKLIDIYHEIEHIYPLSKKIDDLKSIELEVEAESLYPVPDILNLYSELKKQGKTIIFTSDMYLPKEFLVSMLNKAGYKEHDALFVSSELNKTKATGNIWKIIQSSYPGSDYQGKILHIGDDLHSDVEQPKHHNISTMYYPRAKSCRRTGGKPGTGLALSSQWFRLAKIKEKKKVTANVNLSETELEAYNLGYRLGAPVVGGFVQWLLDRFERSKPDRVYFLARDGYLLYDIFKNTQIANKSKIKCQYIFLSRAALNLPGGFIQSTRERLSEPLLEFMCSLNGKVTPKIAVERAGLSGISPLVEDIKSAFVDLNTPLSWHADYPKLREIFERHSAEIYETLKPKYDLLVKYLRQEGLFDEGRFAIVDLGWHASMQANLREILKFSGAKSQIYGYYYGLWPATERNRYKAGHIESFFATPQIPLSRQAAVQWGVPFLEQLHGAPYGTTLGYSVNYDGKIIPILQHSEAEVFQHSNITVHFQNGVKDAIDYSISHGKKFTRDSAISAMGSVFLSPTDAELDVLSKIIHCATFDHSIHETILVDSLPGNDDDLKRILAQSESPLLQLRLFLRNANENQKEQIRAHATQVLQHIDKRLLRQFL